MMLHASDDAGVEGFLAVLDRLRDVCVRVETAGHATVEVRIMSVTSHAATGSTWVTGSTWDDAADEWSGPARTVPVDESTVVTYL